MLQHPSSNSDTNTTLPETTIREALLSLLDKTRESVESYDGEKAEDLQKSVGLIEPGTGCYCPACVELGLIISLTCKMILNHMDEYGTSGRDVTHHVIERLMIVSRYGLFA